jgi:2-dehydro-3-deoxygalactonokinase
MIAVDWGTSGFRAWRLGAGGRMLDSREAPRGILFVKDGRFAETLRAEIGAWLAAGERRVVMSGMIGSRQGWVEAPYLPCPAGLADLAMSLVRVPFGDADVRLVPGLTCADAAGVPEVMRGEETQVASMLGDGASTICLPGSHSKWVQAVGGRIMGFSTYFAGEMFAALRGATILGRMMTDGPTEFASFDLGVARSGEAGHLLHQLFGVRTLGLMGRLADTDSASYLSGLLIGHEVRAAMPADAEVDLIGAEALCTMYARAIASCGGRVGALNAGSAQRGLTMIGERVRWD